MPFRIIILLLLASTIQAQELYPFGFDQDNPDAPKES